MQQIRKDNVPWIIAGDINIDLCKYTKHIPTNNYVNNLLINNFIPIIVMPTRVTDTSASLVDHIYYFEGTNVKMDCNIMSGNLWSDISDHLPNYMIITKKAMAKCFTNRLHVRLFSKVNIDKFYNMLYATDWSGVYQSEDVNLCYNLFAQQLEKCFNTCFPEILLSRKRSNDKKWFTLGLKVSCKHKKNCL